MKPSLSLEVDKYRTMRVIESMQLGANGKPWGWPTSDEEINTLLNNTWAVGLSEAIKAAMSAEDASFPLKPRMRYMLTCTVRIDPVYRVASKYSASMTLNRWNFYVQGVTIEETQMDYSKRSKSTVRVVFKVAETSTRQKERFAYDINSFMTSVGAWTGLWAVGLGLLNKWQKRTMPFGMATADEAYAYLEPKYAKLEKKQMNKIEYTFKAMLPFCRCCCGLRKKDHDKVAPAPEK